MLQKTDVVVFDFDGTLSALDSSIEFGRYCMKHSVRPWLFLPLMGVCAVVRMFKPDGVWWRTYIRRFLTADMVRRLAPDFIKQHKRERFGWAKEQVQAERDAGRKVLLVSASPDYLVPFLVSDMKFDVIICTNVDREKPWKINFLCWGKNKVVAMDAWARANKIIPRVVRSYSDSASDMPMMEIATERVWIDRKTGLRRAE